MAFGGVPIALRNEGHEMGVMEMGVLVQNLTAVLCSVAVDNGLEPALASKLIWVHCR